MVGLEYLLCFLLRPEENSHRRRQLCREAKCTEHTPTHTHTYWLSCFQRWKKSCEDISVGWKNLLMVTGSLSVRFCRAPPYLIGHSSYISRLEYWIGSCFHIKVKFILKCSTLALMWLPLSVCSHDCVVLLSVPPSASDWLHVMSFPPHIPVQTTVRITYCCWCNGWCFQSVPFSVTEFAMHL